MLLFVRLTLQRRLVVLGDGGAAVAYLETQSIAFLLLETPRSAFSDRDGFGLHPAAYGTCEIYQDSCSLATMFLLGWTYRLPFMLHTGIAAVYSVDGWMDVSPFVWGCSMRHLA